MNRQPHFEKRELVVAEAIGEFVSELRLIEVADFIAFIRMERFANLADLIDSAAELYFMPGTLKLGHGGEAHVSWAGEPRIVLDMEMRPRGATVYFALTLTEKHAEIDVNFVSFAEPCDHPDDNTALLAAALKRARLVKTSALSL